MAYNRIVAKNFPIQFVAGDTEYIRLNIKDDAGNIIDVSSNVTVRLGIKKYKADDKFIVPEIIGATYAYNATTQKYTIEFALSSADTIALLNYGGKRRNLLKCFYDIEMHEVRQGVDERTTLLAGTLQVARSLSGAV